LQVAAVLLLAVHQVAAVQAEFYKQRFTLQLEASQFPSVQAVQELKVLALDSQQASTMLLAPLAVVAVVETPHETLSQWMAVRVVALEHQDMAVLELLRAEVHKAIQVAQVTARHKAVAAAVQVLQVQPMLAETGSVLVLSRAELLPVWLQAVAHHQAEQQAQAAAVRQVQAEQQTLVAVVVVVAVTVDRELRTLGLKYERTIFRTN
jgi:hypothetical protein